MDNFDPVNNRDDFQKSIEDLYDFSKYVNMKKFTYKMGKKKDIAGDLAKMDLCEDSINNYLEAWDNCETEEDRRILVCSIEYPDI